MFFKNLCPQNFRVVPALSQSVLEVSGGGGGYVDLLERDEERGAPLHLEDCAVALLGHAHRLQLALPDVVTGPWACSSVCSYRR